MATGKTDELKNEIKKLRKKYDSDAIFSTLMEIASDTDKSYLTDEIISYLTINEGMNVVKVEGLNQQIQFENSMAVLFPYNNDREINLFTSY